MFMTWPTPPSTTSIHTSPGTVGPCGPFVYLREGFIPVTRIHVVSRLSSSRPLGRKSGSPVF